jgi:alkylated DNA repair dioxygenase AlkB
MRSHRTGLVGGPSFQLTSRIKQNVAAALGETVEFNEVLSVLYREGQKMSWHDDGEEGRQPSARADPRSWAGCCFAQSGQ